MFVIYKKYRNKAIMLKQCNTELEAKQKLAELNQKEYFIFKL